MKWIPTAFLSLVPLAQAEEVPSNNVRMLRRNDADSSGQPPAATPAADSLPSLLADSSKSSRHLAHGEKREQRKNNKNKSYTSTASMEETGEETTPSTETTPMIEATTTSTTTTTTPVDNSYSNGNQLRSSIQSSSTRTKHLHVSHVYTYGAPSVVKGPAMSNPNNACIPGLRIFTEDFEVKTCSWWKPWCTPGGEEVTNVDFASQINVKKGYPHPKMATLVVRLGEGWKVEYTYRPCRDYENVKEYSHQWWPRADVESDLIPGWNNHGLVDHYETRLLQVPTYIKGPSLEYVSVARCSYKSSYADIQYCLNHYDRETSSRINGVATSGWQTFAFMSRSNERFLSDSDNVYVLKNDWNPNYRKCIIGFQGSDHAADLSLFVMGSTDPTGYCGRYGVHSGVSNELSKITHDSQYANRIVPALETCHEVTCVGHSLGGSLCNLFTMCANQGLENLDGSDSKQMWDDYDSLIWQAPS